jgi:YidC/Oxa1 family membrane protein insertase
VIRGVAVDAAYHIVSAFADVLAPVAGSLAAAAAIVAFTMTVRLLLLPLSYRAARGMASQARLLPQVQALQKRHAQNPERLQREMADLYQREGTGRFAGCLPTLLQLPFFSVMYQLFRSGTIGGRPNGLLGHDLLGAPLGSHWLSGSGPLSAHGAVFLGLFALLVIVAWVAARVARKATPPVPPGSANQANRGVAVGLVTRVLPYTTVAVAAFMPLAAGLYLLTTTAWSTCERMVMARVQRARRTAPEPSPAPEPSRAPEPPEPANAEPANAAGARRTKPARKPAPRRRASSRSTGRPADRPAHRRR